MNTSRVGMASLVLLAVLIFVAPFTIPRASADPGGRTAGRDYFTDALAPSFGRSVILNGIPTTARTKATFISWINGKINSGSARDKTGAQFIVQLMRGAPYDYSRPSSADITAWEALINQSNVTLSVQTVGYTWDAAYDIGHNDDYFYDGPSLSAPALVFKQNGVTVFEIRLACANPIGNLPGIKLNPPATWSLSATTTVNKASGYPGDTATFTHSIIKSGPGAAAYRDRICDGYYTAYTSAPTNCGPYSGTQSGSATAQRTVTLPVAEQGKYYCQRIEYTPAGSSGGSGASIGRCVHITPVTLSCGTMSIVPNDGLDPKSTFSITVSAASSSPGVLNGDAMTLTIRPKSGGAGWRYGPVTVPASDPTDPVSVTFSNLGPTNETGQWDVSWTYTAAGGYSKTCGAPADASAYFSVANKPYLHVYGGDVMAGNAALGQSTDGSQSCAPANSDAGVYSWNNHSTDFSGAGAQYAVMALNQVLDFSSASELPTGANGTPTGLSFANAGLTPAQLTPSAGLFGGSFGTTPLSCDFTSDLTVPATNSNVTVGATVVTPATPPVLVVGHDVYINGNVTYNNPRGWRTPADIPLYKLVVIGGNIYIGAGVTELDGIYVAEQDESGNGGTIYTCATGPNTPADILNVGSGPSRFYSQCHNKLSIYGAFAAQQIQFLRTPGTIGEAAGDTPAANNAAEVFYYSPEVWLPRGSSSAPVSPKYDAITGLPPIL